MDFSKAFNKICRSHLIYKLKRSRITYRPSRHWIHNFLTDRQQVVLFAPKMEQLWWSLHLMTTTMLMMMMIWMQCAASSGPMVQAPWGALQGISLEGDGGRKMNAYLGIPYAVPPVGDLRFQKPQPHPGPGEGQVFMADKIMPPCPQMPMLIGSRETSEDCLMLDVYVPAGDDPDSGKVKPHAVMVWIHGGGFTLGDAHFYRPSKLVVDGGVIVVVLQYRLGVLGFFYSGDNALTANLGLWDQNLALRWVKDNIREFGGDPGRITLFGESAGSMSTGLHLVIPRSQGLFHRAILQSGAPQNVVHFMDNFDKKAVFKGLVDMVGCQGDSSVEMLQCLKQTPLDHLVNKSNEYSSPMLNYYVPVLDGDLIPRSPRELKKGEDVEVMIGFNKHEGAIILVIQFMTQWPSEALYTADVFRNILDLCLACNSRSHNPVLKQMVEFFYRGAEASRNMSASLDPLVNMYGDCLMTVAIAEWTRILSTPAPAAADADHPRSTAPCYLYVMDHDFACNSQGPIPGAHHGDEILLLFDNQQEFPEGSLFFLLNKTVISSEEEQGLARKMVDVWTTFARTGNPSGPLKGDLQGGEWLPFTVDEEHYLSFSNTPSLVSHLGPYRDRVALWSNLLPELDALVSQMPAAQESGDGHQPPTPPAREDL